MNNQEGRRPASHCAIGLTAASTSRPDVRGSDGDGLQGVDSGRSGGGDRNVSYLALFEGPLLAQSRREVRPR